jgi:hypothetical protein
MAQLTLNREPEIVGAWEWVAPVTSGVSNMVTSLFAPEPVVIEAKPFPWIPVVVGGVAFVIFAGIVLKISTKKKRKK